MDKFKKMFGAPFSIIATTLILVAVPFIKIAKKLGHDYWQW